MNDTTQQGQIGFSGEGADFVLHATQWLPATAETLWRFVGDCRHMNHVIPGFVRFQILSADLGLVATGRRYDYRLRLRGVPVKWRTLITHVDHPHAFTDTQEKGPYARFEHTHLFTPTRGGTEVQDIIRYRPPGGPLARAVNVIVRHELRALFAHRHRRLSTLYTHHAAGGPDPADHL